MTLITNNDYCKNINQLNIKAGALLAISAAQMLHDIKSPLATLNIIASELATEDNELKCIMREALNHINAIAADFSSRNLNANKANICADESAAILSNVIETVISGKKIEFKSKKIEFSFTKDDGAIDAKCIFNEADLKRILSNLINNAVDAIAEQGKVDIILKTNDAHLAIEIIDNGCGIPEEWQSQIFKQGFSTKKKGFGIGLYHAKNTLLKCGGFIDFQSTLGVGTTITLMLPK